MFYNKNCQRLGLNIDYYELKETRCNYISHQLNISVEEAFFPDREIATVL